MSEQGKFNQDKIKWEMATIRKAISVDWSLLASKDLPPTRRAAVREHLAMNCDALKDLRLKFGANRTRAARWREHKAR